MIRRLMAALIAPLIILFLSGCVTHRNLEASYTLLERMEREQSNDWVLIKEYIDKWQTHQKEYINVKSILYLPNGNVRFWESAFRKGGKICVHSKTAYEIDCSNQMAICWRSDGCFIEDGKLFPLPPGGCLAPKWRPIEPDESLYTVWETFCSKK